MRRAAGRAGRGCAQIGGGTKAVGLVAILALASAALGSPAAACRCVPQGIEEYFQRADVVVLARAASTRAVGSERLEVALVPLDDPFKGRIEPRSRFATALTSAECGMAIETGRAYLVFASRREPSAPLLWFDTCNGSRSFDAEGSGGVVGFVDTPADKVLLRLQGLRIAHSVANPGADPDGPRLPRPGDPDAEIIGLLELPSVLNLDEPGADSPPPRLPTRPVAARAEPASDAPVVARIAAPQDVRTAEYTYERKAAIVREQRAGWYRILLAGGRSGWVRREDAGAFHPVAELLVDHLAYLNEHWDGWVWPDPGAGFPVRSPVKKRDGRQEYAVNVLGVQDLAGTLWLRVEVLSASPCGEGSPTVTNRGWVPAYTPEGKLIAWFFSRGC